MKRSAPNHCKGVLMAKREAYEQKTAALAEDAILKNGCTLYDTEFVKEGSGYVLRLSIEKEGGVTIDDCVNISRALSDKLDREDFISEAYTLEVTSLGLGRPIKKEKDYLRNLEKEIEVRTYKPIGGLKEFVGTLLSFTPDEITVQTGDETLLIEKKNISLIREYVDWDEQ